MNTVEMDSPDAAQDSPALRTVPNGYVVKLLPLDELLPHEEHDHDCAVQLATAMAMNGYMSRPVVVEERTRTLLDGHHRVAALAILGCKFVPGVLLSYEDPRVYLDGWRPGVAVDRDMVLTAALRGHLLPRKTTRHQINPDLDQIKVELALLNSDH